MKLFVLHHALALLWTFLSARPSVGSFAIGWGLAFLLIAGAERLFPGSRYVARLAAFARFWFTFLREFVKSNLSLARAILVGSKDEIWPGFVAYDVSDLADWEILVLAHCIALTPGTSIVDRRDEGRILFIHAFDARDPDRVRREIDRGLREPMLRWTR